MYKCIKRLLKNNKIKVGLYKYFNQKLGQYDTSYDETATKK